MTNPGTPLQLSYQSPLKDGDKTGEISVTISVISDEPDMKFKPEHVAEIAMRLIAAGFVQEERVSSVDMRYVMEAAHAAAMHYGHISIGDVDAVVNTVDSA